MSTAQMQGRPRRARGLTQFLVRVLSGRMQVPVLPERLLDNGVAILALAPPGCL
ncbi:hypothetical protein [Streptomyces sp. SYSU K217416]